MKPSQLIPFGKVDAAFDDIHADMEFAYKRAKVLADMLEIPVHESPEVTGTILGLVRGKVEKLTADNARYKAALIELTTGYSGEMVCKIAREALDNSVKILTSEGLLLDDVKRLSDLICNSLPETPIKGEIESLAYSIGHHPLIIGRVI